ncbi:Uncharacterised protein [Corynebacterium renale]|uniref:Uncharacterized protein n=1 Tax=Corynebacterium renale TaxID=1724 RepID=A0A2A9DN46_9CORY|nr:hypothetical protein ATK06_0655 [Corynebacterium renale]SQI23014.1 Uncharacterised protein [Corynebacterium renale]
MRIHACVVGQAGAVFARGCREFFVRTKISPVLLHATRLKPEGNSQPGATAPALPVHATFTSMLAKARRAQHATDFPIRWDSGGFRFRFSASALTPTTLGLRARLNIPGRAEPSARPRPGILTPADKYARPCALPAPKSSAFALAKRATLAGRPALAKRPVAALAGRRASISGLDLAQLLQQLAGVRVL